MAETVDKKRIAKNTIFLYIRMFVSMAVGIFTSRVTLEYLGITDYGIYQSVGGIVGMVSFANTAISTGISRFITVGLGRGNLANLRRLFATLLSTQLVFIGILVVVAETVGLWFVSHKLVIPEGSMNAALFAYHLSVITMAISMVANPFTAIITAHEHMKIYAYISLVSTFAILGAAYILTTVDSGRLYLYSFLLFLISVGSLLFQIYYSYRNFTETTFKILFDKKMIKEVAGFSGWSLFAALSTTLNNQGILILLNMFFSPAVVAARAVSLTVNTSATSFVGNFRAAMNPQIVKQHAAGNTDVSKKLLLNSTKFSFFLMLLLSVPIFFLAGPLLSLWLTKVPPYAEIFLKIVIIQSLFQIFDTSFYTALYAKGQLKENALISPTIGFLCFPIVYILFKNGASPVVMSWGTLITYAILGVVVKPILLVRIVNYKWSEIRSVLVTSLGIGVITFIIGYLVYNVLYTPGILGFVTTVLAIVATTILIIYLLGITPQMRTLINTKIKARLFHFKSVCY